jgi:PAS domain-containing protein
MDERPTYEELEQRVKELEKTVLKCKGAEEALQESEGFLQDFFNAIGDGVSVLDLDLNIIRVNSWMEKMYSREGGLVRNMCYEVYQNRDTPFS